MRTGIRAAAGLALLVLLGIGVIYTREARRPGLAQHTLVPPPRSQTSLAVDPSDGRLIKATSQGLSRSVDGGRTWETVPLPARIAPSGISQIVVNPDKPTFIYTAGIGTGVILSQDRGASWRPINTGLPSAQVEALAIHAFRRETLFVSIRGRGMYRTEDGGQQWQRMDGGPEGKSVLALAHSPLEGSMNTGWLYAGTANGPYLSMDCF